MAYNQSISQSCAKNQLSCDFENKIKSTLRWCLILSFSLSALEMTNGDDKD